jgi:hypothetical protein
VQPAEPAASIATVSPHLLRSSAKHANQVRGGVERIGDCCATSDRNGGPEVIADEGDEQLPTR